MRHIRGRELWGARAARSIVSQTPDSIYCLVVHHTAGKAPVTMAGCKREMRNIQNQHMDANGWSDIGYNIVIDRMGRIWEGRGLRRVGAHTKGCNTGTIGVSFMGNYETMQLNRLQIAAFKDLKARLHLHGIHVDEVRGHRQMPRQATACPGKHIMRQLGL